MCCAFTHALPSRRLQSVTPLHRFCLLDISVCATATGDCTMHWSIPQLQSCADAPNGLYLPSGDIALELMRLLTKATRLFILSAYCDLAGLPAALPVLVQPVLRKYVLVAHRLYSQAVHVLPAALAGFCNSDLPLDGNHTLILFGWLVGWLQSHLVAKPRWPCACTAGCDSSVLIRSSHLDCLLDMCTHLSCVVETRCQESMAAAVDM